MALKRVVLLLALLLTLANASVQAQESGPLVMRAEFEWTIAGVVAGAAVGVLLWLTDPGNPSNNLGDSVAGGAAWGAVAGAGFGVFILQRTYVPPANASLGSPLNPTNRISTDPIARQGGSPAVALQTRSDSGGRAIQLPVLSLHF